MADKSSNIKERILQLAEYKGVVKEKFFEEINMTYGNFKGKSKRTPINSNAIVDIYAIYPDINIEWLLTGKGDMIKKEGVSEKFVPFEDPEKRALEQKISQLQEKIIALLEENTQLKDQLATKSNKHTADRPVAGKLKA